MQPENQYNAGFDRHPPRGREIRVIAEMHDRHRLPFQLHTIPVATHDLLVLNPRPDLFGCRLQAHLAP